MHANFRSVCLSVSLMSSVLQLAPHTHTQATQWQPQHDCMYNEFSAEITSSISYSIFIGIYNIQNRKRCGGGEPTFCIFVRIYRQRENELAKKREKKARTKCE